MSLNIISFILKHYNYLLLQHHKTKNNVLFCLVTIGFRVGGKQLVLFPSQFYNLELIILHNTIDNTFDIYNTKKFKFFYFLILYYLLTFKLYETPI